MMNHPHRTERSILSSDFIFLKSGFPGRLTVRLRSPSEMERAREGAPRSLAMMQVVMQVVAVGGRTAMKAHAIGPVTAAGFTAAFLGVQALAQSTTGAVESHVGAVSCWTTRRSGTLIVTMRGGCNARAEA
jgi:hypothetical protein